ncbi:MAG: class III extradiol ring-cleavage dioxygenase [Lautropia sp.]
MNQQLLLPTLFVSHGGGPWPFMGDRLPSYARTADELLNLSGRLPAKPAAILVVSGHWEEAEFTVSTAPRPPMLYDYSGFPAHTYRLQYPAPGSPSLAGRVKAMVAAAGMECREDASRGFDHGTFVPLMLMFPEAAIPVVTVSMKSTYDPEEHIRLGEALASLRGEGVLIIGSGLSYHNMRGFRHESSTPVARAFEAYLNEAVSHPSPSVRRQMLVEWEQAPFARAAHPMEDHLIPLMVAAGAAGQDSGGRIFVENVMQVDMASYRFGELAERPGPHPGAG